MTKNQLEVRRANAGRHYAEAVQELQTALIDLAAIEVLLAEERSKVKTDGKAVNLLTFGAHHPDAFAELKHREFVPNPPTKLKAKIAERVAELRDD